MCVQLHGLLEGMKEEGTDMPHLSLRGGKVTHCQSLCLTATCGGLVEDNRTRTHHVVLV